MFLRRLLVSVGCIALTAGAAQAGPFGIFGNRCQSGACCSQTAPPTSVATVTQTTVVAEARPAAKTYRFPRLHPFKGASATECSAQAAPVFTGQLANQTRSIVGRVAGTSCSNGSCGR